MIKFSQPLTKATLVKRYKRFFADVILEDGTEVTSHCPNTGSMKACGSPGDTVYLLDSDNPKRKLRYTWEYTKVKGGYIGINTQRPNRIVEAAIAQDQIPELLGYRSLKREQKYGEGSKIDLLLDDPDRPPCYVEIKNVTLVEGDSLLFPDAVSLRGQKHLNELIKVKKAGGRAVMFYLINRPDGRLFSTAAAIDPGYARCFEQAVASGVEILRYRVKATLSGMAIDTKGQVAQSPETC